MAYTMGYGSIKTLDKKVLLKYICYEEDTTYAYLCNHK